MPHKKAKNKGKGPANQNLVIASTSEAKPDPNPVVQSKDGSATPVAVEAPLQPANVPRSAPPIFELAAEKEEIGEDVEPEEAQCPTPAWRVRHMIEGIVRAGKAPKKSKLREDMIQNMFDSKVNSHFISDCFTWANEKVEHDSALGGRSERSGCTDTARSVKSDSVGNFSRDELSSLEVDHKSREKISLMNKIRTVRDTDIVIAKIRDGRTNYIQEKVVESQQLDRQTPDTVVAYVGIFEGGFHRSTRVTLIIRHNNGSEPLVLLGSDFRNAIKSDAVYQQPIPALSQKVQESISGNSGSLPRSDDAEDHNYRLDKRSSLESKTPKDNETYGQLLNIVGNMVDMYKTQNGAGDSGYVTRTDSSEASKRLVGK